MPPTWTPRWWMPSAWTPPTWTLRRLPRWAPCSMPPRRTAFREPRAPQPAADHRAVPPAACRGAAALYTLGLDAAHARCAQPRTARLGAVSRADELGEDFYFVVGRFALPV
jgi:hypothetical protein